MSLEKRTTFAVLALLGSTLPGTGTAITLINGDFSSPAITNANDGVKNIDSPAGLNAGWSSGSRGNPWDASTGAAQIAWSNRAEALYQTVSVTDVSPSPTSFIFSFDAEILPDARAALEGSVEIYTWESAGSTPQIDTESSLIQAVYSAGSLGDATLALSGETEIGSAGVRFLDDKAFLTGNGLVNGETSGTFSKEFTLPANHDRVAVVFSVENQQNTTIDNTLFGFQIDNVTITPAVAPPRPDIVGIRNLPGDRLELTWKSQAGKVYDLLSSSDPATDGDPATWPVVAGEEGIAATPPANTHTIGRPLDPTRLYAVLERNAPPPPPAFSDDFESVPDPDWTTGANGSDGGNTEWQRGAPGSFVSAGLPPIGGANGSTNCFGTNLAADYGPDTDIYLRSPAIDLTAGGLTKATLTLWHYLDTEFSTDDAGSIRVLKAGDLTPLGEDLATGLNGFPNNNTDWQELEVDLPNEALGQTIILEFQFISDNDEHYSGWYIDEVVVEVE